MKTALMVLITTAMLAGCCSVKEVMVPVSSCHAPPAFSAPTLQVDSLSADATTKQKLEAIRLDYGALRSSLNQCITLLDAYRKPIEPKIEPEN